IDQHLRVDFLLDVERRRIDDEIAPVLLVLASPDELGIEVRVAWVAQFDRLLDIPAGQRSVLGGRDVPALRGTMADGLDGLPALRASGALRRLRGLRHGQSLVPSVGALTVARTLPSSPAIAALRSSSSM